MASHDCHVYLYSVDVGACKYARRALCSGHSASVTHVDWSADSAYLQVTKYGKLSHRVFTECIQR